MIKSRLNFDGLGSLEDDLKMLTQAESDRVRRQGARAGAGVIRDEARRRAPKRSGKLSRNIVAVTVKVSEGHRAAAGVRVRSRGKADDPSNAFYWRFVELGTSKMPPAPFIRPAFDAKEQEAGDAAIAKVTEALDKVLKK
ncbi:HK97 gp10 family phage protein [Halomonas daqingensis]|uniref:HK97 gp10 family phage protein n=1 Tax=Billgrantia desiderata TaxID=52021 RepID=A0ABS9B495_9GAMM|nr:HK97-gp10 family putative phage morphogenesis protein [Halomonas desiderata]MCE8042437.1 HK97 gp10 family phage protein [Halomonas desiderata]MCE8047012.1 HK97 gp10 family phage protein [Halomonas desiderata]